MDIEGSLSFPFPQSSSGSGDVQVIPSLFLSLSLSPSQYRSSCSEWEGKHGLSEKLGSIGKLKMFSSISYEGTELFMSNVVVLTSLERASFSVALYPRKLSLRGFRLPRFLWRRRTDRLEFIPKVGCNKFLITPLENTTDKKLRQTSDTQQVALMSSDQNNNTQAQYAAATAVSCGNMTARARVCCCRRVNVAGKHEYTQKTSY